MEDFIQILQELRNHITFIQFHHKKTTDGIAQVALGLGKIVVEGGNTVRFCPKYPKNLIQFYSTKETVRTSQQYFYAIDLNEEFRSLKHSPEEFVKNF